jgi:tetratricopeptide (TPR) repeat protein
MRSFSCLVVAVALALGRATVAQAETCPEIPAEESGLRRSMAKEWFAKAEEAEAGGDRSAAVRRYSCSLNLTPHPSTAYNLGTVAEKSGDWSMAIEGFRAYLKLSPEAPDRPTIEARVVALEAKLAELRKDLATKNSTANAPANTTPGTVPGASPAAPPLASAPLSPLPAPLPPRDGVHGRRVAGWIMLVAAATTAGTGLALNLVARSKVHECYRQWGSTAEPAALDRCDEARPFAYGSYALFAAGGALGATSLLLLLWPSGSTGDETPPPETEVSFVPSVSFFPAVGGGSAVFSGRF